MSNQGSTWLTPEEKDFILQNKDLLFVGQIAKMLNRPQTTIRNYLSKNKLTYKKYVKQNNPELTESEIKIMELLSQGYTPNEIKEKLVIEYSTCKSHLNAIFQKLNKGGFDKMTQVIAVLVYLKEYKNYNLKIKGE